MANERKGRSYYDNLKKINQFIKEAAALAAQQETSLIAEECIAEYTAQILEGYRDQLPKE